MRYINRKSLLTVILLVLVLVFSGCQEADNSDKNLESKDLKVIKVASHTDPMTTMLELVASDLEEEGYKLELKTVSDNVQANVALQNKEVDANFFQHSLFMKMFNEGNDADLVDITAVYNAIVAYYGRDIKSIEDIKDNAVIGIPSDPTNMTRALRLLAHNKLIELKDPESYAVKIEDVIANPKNLKFELVSLLNLNEAYKEMDLVFNYPTYIAKIGLTPQNDGIMIEDGDSHFAISLVAREDNKNSEEILALKKALNSEKIKQFIEDKLSGHAIVAFE